ncbi:MAG TPA: EpsI family protein [Bryobacteraceae bacterium]|nr:EpsI family protein [Bryobacteraceae bacterium]
MRSSAALAATALLVAQAALLYSAIRPEAVVPGPPLVQMPLMLGAWQFAQDGVIDQETLDVLRADDILNRVYTRGPQGAYLFVAAFRSQRTGKTPHSPKNCLPGGGWTPLSSGEIAIDTGSTGTAGPITVNRFVVAHGEERSLVLYWYQSRDRVVASEYKAKFWVMADAIRLNRTDTALVRVVVPIRDRDEDTAERTAIDFVKSFYGTLREYLPA